MVTIPFGLPQVAFVGVKICAVGPAKSVGSLVSELSIVNGE